MRHPSHVGVKHNRAYEIKENKLPPASVSDSGEPKRSPGAQPGHKGHSRSPPARIDEVVTVDVDLCPECDGHMLSSVQETRLHTVEDVRIVEAVTTQYAVNRRYCLDCKKNSWKRQFQVYYLGLASACAPCSS